jgi:hypothetical protein
MSASTSGRTWNVVQPRAAAPSTLFATSAYLHRRLRDGTDTGGATLPRNSLAEAQVFHQDGAGANHVSGDRRAAVVVLRLPPAGEGMKERRERKCGWE